jgi:nucleotide-binding universal stress UspA family protein
MTRIQRIVCPTDFSPTAAKAVDYAADLARSLGAELVLLHVIPDLNYPIRGLGMAAAFPHLREEVHARANEQLGALPAKLGQGLVVKTEVRDGAPHDVILAAAKDHGADLIVMGTHGYTGLKHALLGSAAERVVRLATCPVLTVRHPG